MSSLGTAKIFDGYVGKIAYLCNPRLQFGAARHVAYNQPTALWKKSHIFGKIRLILSDEGADLGNNKVMNMIGQLDDKVIRERHRDFEREAMPHVTALYNFALRMTSDPDDANDLLQETYMKAYRFWDKFEPGTNCKAWLFRIMKNSYINIYRKESKEPDKVDYEDIQNFYNTIRSEYTDPNDMEARLYRNLLDDDLTRAVESLPEDFRTVVILCDIEGFTYEEIAEFVDCPIGTVRSRLHRGRKLLRSKLIEYARIRGYNVDEERHRKSRNPEGMEEAMVNGHAIKAN